jgi:hypothetical protein
MAAKRKNSKKASVKKMSQTHGKVEKFEPTTLDQIWGDDGTSMYGTLDDNKYQERLDEMNMSDLQSHASRVGIIPIDNRSMLRERLMREFRKHASSYKKPIETQDDSETVNKDAMKILSEGR